MIDRTLKIQTNHFSICFVANKWYNFVQCIVIINPKPRNKNLFEFGFILQTKLSLNKFKIYFLCLNLIKVSKTYLMKLQVQLRNLKYIYI